MVIPACAALLLLLLPAEAPVGSIVGAVQNEETGRPVDALVLLPDLERAVLTDAEGRYRFDAVPPGPQHLRVQSISYTPRTLHVLVPRRGAIEVNVTLRPDPIRLEPLDVRAPIELPAMGDLGTAYPDVAVSMAAARNQPLYVEPDAFRALEGGDVVLEPEAPSGVHLRGGAADQTTYALDGVPVFWPYHAAGITSAWNPDALEGVRLSASSPTLLDPHALMGTIHGTTRAPGTRLRVRGGASTTQARLTASGPLGRGGAAALVSLRFGFPDALAPRTRDAYVHGDTADRLGTLAFPAGGGRVHAVGYGNNNEIHTRGQDAGDENRFAWEARALGAGWSRSRGASAAEILGWHSAAEARSTWSDPRGSQALHSTREDLGIYAGFERRRARSGTLAEVRVEEIHTRYRVAADSLPARRLERRAPLTSFLVRRSQPLARAVDLELGSALAAYAGRGRLAPRFRAAWTASPTLSLSWSAARTHQFVQSLRNAESVVSSVFPIEPPLGAGAPGVPVAEADRAVAALDWRPVPGGRVRLQAYAVRARQVVLVAPSEGGPFATGAVETGSARSRGWALAAAFSAPRAAVELQYGFQDTRLSHADSVYVPGYGARHLLEGGIVVHPSGATTLHLGATAGFGRRATSIASGFEWEACNLLDGGCEFAGSPYYAGETLGGRALPPYLRVDLGVRAHWHVSWDGHEARCEVFGAVTNLLGRKNVLTYARDPAGDREVAIEMRPQAPLVAGVDWIF